MALTQTQISQLTGDADIAGIDATIVLQQIMAAGAEQMLTAKLATVYEFAGQGRIAALPYTVGVDFGAAKGEAVEVTAEPQTIDKDSATMAKYTLDIPISMEGVMHGVGDPLGAFKEDMGRAYAKKVDGLLWAAGNAATTSDIDCGTTFTMASLVSAYKALAVLKAPQPYIALLHPHHWSQLFGTITLMAPAPAPSWAGGPSVGQYLGRIAGLECFVDPNATGTTMTHATTAYRTLVFAQRGLWWVWKRTQIPQGPNVGAVANGPLGIEVAWRYDFRAWVVSATMFGAAVVRRMGTTDAPWLLNIQDPTV